MSKCSLKSKNLGIAFTNKVKFEDVLGNEKSAEWVTTLLSSLDRNEFDPLVMAHVIHGAMKIPQQSMIGMIKLNNIEEILAYIESKKDSPEKIDANMRRLGFVKGFETFEDIVKSLEKVTHNNFVTVPGQLDVYTSETTSVETHGILIDPKTEAVEVLVIDNAGTEMLKRKASRIVKTKDIKDSSADFWTPFLSTYFPGMSGVGAEFVEWTKDRFYDALIDKSEEQKGFMYDINDGINKIKTTVENEVLSRKTTHPYLFSELNSSVLNGSDDVRTKYFFEVLATDFDFILNNMIKSITVSAKETRATNEIVSGFVDELGTPISARTMRIPASIKKELFERGLKNSYSLKEVTESGTPVPRSLHRVDLDTVSFGLDKTLPNNNFYFTNIDEKYFYRNAKGENLDMTAKAFYSYNSASKRNQNSIDHFIGALDSDSTFIQSLFQMFKKVDSTDDGLAYGDRMTVIDFLTVAPFLTNAGKDLETFVESLKRLANREESEAGRIARSLLVHVFNDVYTQMGNGERVYSIFQATQTSPAARPTINHQIVKALHNALINKDSVKYLKVEENITSITRGVNTSTESDTVNTELAGMLMSDSFTKRGIAQTIKVAKGGKTFSVDLFGKFMAYDDINSVEKCTEVAKALGLQRQFSDIHAKFVSSYTLVKANKAAVNVFKNMLYIAAVNKKEDALTPLEPASKIFEHTNFITMSPTTVISGDSLKLLASLYNVDSHKATSVGGNLTASTSTPNRDSSIGEQINTYNDYNEKVNAVKISFNPFLKGGSSIIPKAEFDGVVLKTSIIKNGNVIKLSDWSVKVRIEHAMVQGFLQGPKQVGKEFYVQPINYSDKSNIQMPKINVPGINLLDPSNETRQLLIDAYIEYQALKNEDLQRITIHGLKEYVIGNFDTLYASIASQADSKDRLDALEQLRLELLEDYSDRKGDLTRSINMLLSTVSLSASEVEYSDSNLDKGADYVSFEGNPGALLLKPHLGIRAAMYRDPVLARAEVEIMLHNNRESLKAMDIDDSKIQDELNIAANKDGIADLVDTTEEFYDRFYLIHGVYGHALKTLTMGDESYFPTRFKKGESIEDYYSAADSGERNGLEESENMLKAQFKRAQSELTRGSVYSQKGTVQGFKRKHSKNNLIQFLDIYGDNVFTRGVTGDKSMAGNELRFEQLQGKTLKELEGMGVISRFSDGQLVNKNGLGMLVKFNVGKDHVVIGDYVDSVFDLKLNINPQLVDSMYSLAKEAIQNTQASQSEAAASVLNVPTGTMVHGVSKDIPGRGYQMTLESYLDEIEKIKRNYFTVMPDLIPSMTISDPVSYINLLNSMGHTQENSDGVQFMHPLMSLIMEEARGGALGAFNTDNQEALKLLTTTFEYDKARQILQKKSVQMPFTTEQMKKLGSMELYNTFKKMNLAIEFKQPSMKVKKGNRTVVKEAKNMQELYELVVNDLDGKYAVDDSIIWAEVLDILRQNPLNMYSFVGLLTLPSNQKTGHKKLNKYDDVFSQKENNKKPRIDYTTNEYNYEVLTKAHDYDVSGVLRHSSTLTLLSQLVNAVSFGGLSDVSTRNLQNAMGGRMMINRLRAGKDLAQVARIIQEKSTSQGKYVALIARLETGNVSTNGLSSDELGAYDEVLRAGVYEMANLAFQKNDSMLIFKVIKGLKITTDDNGNPIETENAYSLDTPAVRSKVMGTLRSAFFKDTVKMKMAGFMGTVSASHKTINIFTLPNGKRVGRAGFVRGALQEGLPEGSEGRVIEITGENIIEVKGQILPFDDVAVITKRADGSVLEQRTMPFGNIPMDMFLSNNITIKGVLTPDILYSAELDRERFDALDENALIRANINGTVKVLYKWYLVENNNPEDIIAMVLRGEIQEEIAEKYSLRWYDYTKDDSTYNLKSSDAYRQYYRAALSKDTSEERMNEVRALLIMETQSKDADGKPVWSTTTPEVVLPTYMAAAFGLERGGSLHDVIGTDGNDLLNATKYFMENRKVAASFITLTTSKVNYTEEVIRIYSRKLVFENNSFDAEVLEFLKENETGETISPAGVKVINIIINKAKKSHATGMAESFLESLYAALTRVPGQGKQSGFTGRVVELLDAQGNATFAPTEHLITTGGDLDIDTLSVLTKSIDANGRMHKPDASLTDGEKGFSIKNLLAKYEFDLTASEKRVRDLVRDSNEQSQKFIDRRKEKLALQTTPAGVALLTLQLSYAEKLLIPEEKVDELIQLNRTKVHALYENIISNVMAEAVFSSLNNVDTSVELNTPISMGMFKELIERIEGHSDNIKAVNNSIKVDRSLGWAVLRDLPVYGNNTVNTMRTRNKEAANKHFGNPFTGTSVPGLIQVGPNVLTREEALLEENSEKVAENIKEAVTLYKTWVTGNSPTAMFTNSAGNTALLSSVSPAQRSWVRDQIGKGKLDGKTFLYMSEKGEYYSHANALADIVGTRTAGQRSGEDFKAIFEYENLAAQGKEAIGIFATVLKINSAIQTAKINYDTRYADEDRLSYDNPFFFKSNLEYVNFISGETEERSRSGFADLDRFSISRDVAKSTVLQRTIASLVNKDKKYSKSSVDTLVNVLKGELKEHLDVSEYGYNSGEALALMESLSKSLFNIKLPSVVLESPTPLEAFSEYLKGNTKMVSKAYTSVIGKQLSNDVQSQFLSAATDNAKELILGKIRSNQLTNPVMTGMMLLGYDTQTIIDFLYDKDVSYVFDYYAAKIGNLERVSINEKDLDAAGMDTTIPSISSLLSLMKVGEEISKFRSVRSLNENAQIEQYKLDKILENLDSHNLYEAIMQDEAGVPDAMSMIKPINDAQNTFNPNLMVFLHPQSRYLFVNLYENEVFRMRSLFKTVGEVSDLAGKASRNNNAYKNIFSYVSEVQVEGFFNQSKTVEEEDGKTKEVFRTGNIVDVAEDGTVTETIVPLNQPANRAAFVKNFEAYLNNAKEMLRTLGGIENAALSQIGRGKSYKSTNTIMYVPKIKNSNADAIESALIAEGINELKIKTGNHEVDRIQKEIYNNLSNYAMIVSSGEIKKGSMIELFEEINLSLAEYLNTLNSKHYKDIRPVTDFIPTLIKGEVLFEDAVISKSKTDENRRRNEDEIEMHQAAQELANQVPDDLQQDLFEGDAMQDAMEQSDTFEMRGVTFVRNKQSKIVRSVFKGKRWTVNNIFKVMDPDLKSDIFYAYKSGEVAYRLFPAEANEALPTTTLPSSVDFKKIDKDVVRDLGRTGYQVGFSAVYEGEPVRILAYNGHGAGYEEYLVAHPSGTQLIPGVHLMEENPDLLLSGNIIQEIRSSNRIKTLAKKRYNKTIIDRIPNLMTPVDNTVTVFSSYAFTDDDIQRDPIISRESRVLGTPGKAYDVIKLKNSAIANATKSFVAYNTNEKFIAANNGSTRTLVPSLYIAIKGGEISLQDAEIMDEMMSRVAGMLNTAEVGMDVSFYGLGAKTNFKKSGPHVLAGGLDILNNFLGSFKRRKGSDGISVLEGAFDIVEEFDQAADMYKVTITKKRDNVGLVFVGGIATAVHTEKDKKSRAVSTKEWVNDQIKLKAIEQGVITPIHKIMTVGIEGSKESIVVLKTDEGVYEIFIRKLDRGYNDKYIKIRSTSNKDSIFDLVNNTYDMPADKYALLVQIIKDDKTKANNLTCL